MAQLGPLSRHLTELPRRRWPRVCSLICEVHGGTACFLGHSVFVGSIRFSTGRDAEGLHPSHLFLLETALSPLPRGLSSLTPCFIKAHKPRKQQSLLETNKSQYFMTKSWKWHSLNVAVRSRRKCSLAAVVEAALPQGVPRTQTMAGINRSRETLKLYPSISFYR